MRLRGLIAAWCLVSAVGCVTPHGSVAVDVDPAAWFRPAELGYENTDTTALRAMNIYLSCNNLFRVDTLTVEVATLTPDSLRHSEHFVLAIPAVESPAALRREVEIPYRRDVCLQRPGRYTITVTPVRRVKGVEAVGINFVNQDGKR